MDSSGIHDQRILVEWIQFVFPNSSRDSWAIGTTIENTQVGCPIAQLLAGLSRGTFNAGFNLLILPTQVCAII